MINHLHKNRLTKVYHHVILFSFPASLYVPARPSHSKNIIKKRLSPAVGNVQKENVMLEKYSILYRVFLIKANVFL